MSWEAYLVAATIAGPILAVQAQKYLERHQDKKRAKDQIFRTLMATRATRLSIEHVQALNGIELAFYGSDKKDKRVSDAWKEYHDHLNTPPAKYDRDPDKWGDKQTELFIALLHEMALSLGYDFDKTHIKNNWYSPEGHVTVEKEMHIIRNGLAEILTGKRCFPVVGFATSEEEAKEIAEMRRSLIDWLKRNQHIQTVVSNEDSKLHSPSQKLLS